MRTDYDLAGEQTGHTRICATCGKKYYESLFRAGPERGKRLVCAYCCRYCTSSYRDGSTQGCRAEDAERQKDREKRKRDRAWS